MDDEPWEEIFKYWFTVRVLIGCEPNFANYRDYPRISSEDIDEILYVSEGINDDALDWLLLFRMKDGRYCHVWAGCCYTGFSASGTVDCFIHADLDYLVSYGITWEQRFRYFFSRNQRQNVREKLNAVRHRT